MTHKRNEVPQIDALEGVITGDWVIERMNPQFQIWINLKRLLKELNPISYENNIDAKIALEALKARHISLRKHW